MKPYLAIYDDFFSPAYLRLFDAIMSAGKFSDVTSPTDGITYPGILLAEPDAKLYLQIRISQLLDVPVPVELSQCFFRLTSSAQKEAPNKIHNDASMGTHAALIYMSREWSRGAGTSFWTHVTEGEYQKESCDAALVQSHTNRQDQWSFRFFVPGVRNRILLYDARLWHCAEPVGGFGSGPADGRIVLTCFFNIK